MKRFLGFLIKTQVCGFVVGAILMTAVIPTMYLWTMDDYVPLTRPELQKGVESGYGVINYLGGDWYLVEVQRDYWTTNPLPFGKKDIKVRVPHLVRLRKRELDKVLNGR